MNKPSIYVYCGANHQLRIEYSLGDHVIKLLVVKFDMNKSLEKYSAIIH